MTNSEMIRLLNFLLGAGPNNDGLWFDELAQKYPNSFWWRKYLRQYAALSDATIAAAYEDAAAWMSARADISVLVAEANMKLTTESDPPFKRAVAETAHSEAARGAFIDGATAVHEEWHRAHSKGEGPPKCADFDEAADDYAAAIREARHDT